MQNLDQYAKFFNLNLGKYLSEMNKSVQSGKLSFTVIINKSR